MLLKNFEKEYPDLPSDAGVYKYYNKSNEIIYVGKAKNLKKRINSYFKNYDNLPFKNKVLVKNIHRIELVIVNNEHDALILENNLIKSLQPRYNINLKDDKTFPYLVIRNEPFPRVYLTRTKINDGSEYLGPVTNVVLARFILNFIRDNLQFRTCKLNLTNSNIQKKKFKVCLQYHIKKCKAPCEGLQEEADYNQSIKDIKTLFKNNFKDVLHEYKIKMHEASDTFNFELAQLYKEKIEAIYEFESRSKVEASTETNLDVFGMDSFENICIITYAQIRTGKITATQILNLETKLNETKEEILCFGIERFYAENQCEVNEIIVQEQIKPMIGNVLITIPHKGYKKDFLDFTLKNSTFFKMEIAKQKFTTTRKNNDTQKLQIIEDLKNDLHLNINPLRIECFDNSNFQGSYPVSAMVSFLNGMPDKSNYRVFKVRTVSGIDDFATMGEVIHRRYKKLKEQDLPLPDLIIIDGGKGQLNAATDSLKKLDLYGKINIIGLAKKNEEIFFPNDKESIRLPFNSPTLNLLKQIRDEVHRFGITFHRKLRFKGTIKTSLLNIDGIGEETAKQMLKHFKSIENIKHATPEEIAQIIGNAKMKLITHYFNLS